MSRTDEASLIKRYLLGELTEQEQKAVEERMMIDPDYYNSVLLAEDDLIDEYVSGELSGERRESFVSRFMSVPRRQIKVTLSKLLVGYTLQNPNAKLAARNIGRERAGGLNWISPAPSRYWVAACLLILLSLAFFTTWLLWENRRLNGEIREDRKATINQEDYEQIQKRLADTQAEARRSQQQLLDEQAARSRLEKELATLESSRNAEPELPKHKLASFTISAGMLRDTGQPNIINLPRSVDVLQLKLRLNDDSHLLYYAEARMDEGKVIWQQNHLSAQQDKKTRAIVINLPAGKLNSGDYIVSLQDAQRKGEGEVIADYYFRILKK
ncbi:MAG TPA: hypothetical protein VLR90_10790 [Blastocatellia bacterium]|nr:hypothetical protein [Blastocatellia bacterium]